MKIEYNQSEILVHLTLENAKELGRNAIETGSKVADELGQEFFKKYFCDACEGELDSEGICRNEQCSNNPDYTPDPVSDE